MNQNLPGSKQAPISNTDAAGIAAQMGCVMFGIVLGALLLGIWLDRMLALRGFFTILLILASVPLTWYFIFWRVNLLRKQTLAGTKDSLSPKQFEEENHRDDN